MQRDTTNVLMIDDNEDDFVIVRRYLSRVEEHSHCVQWAASYEDGLAELHEGNFDVCLVDYRLGASTGIELIEATAKWNSRPPFHFADRLRRPRRRRTSHECRRG